MCAPTTMAGRILTVAAVAAATAAVVAHPVAHAGDHSKAVDVKGGHVQHYRRTPVLRACPRPPLPLHLGSQPSTAQLAPPAGH